MSRDHRSLIVGLGSLAAVSIFGALVYFFAYDPITDKASDTVTRVTTLEQGAPCLPDETGQPRRPRDCRRSFSQAVQTLTTAQACRIVQKGATLLVVNGNRVQSVECRFANGKQIGAGRDGQSEAGESQASAAAETPRDTPSPETSEPPPKDPQAPQDPPPTPDPQPQPEPLPQPQPAPEPSPGPAPDVLDSPGLLDPALTPVCGLSPLGIPLCS